MGAHRRRNQNQAEEKIFMSELMADFGLDKSVLYKTWLAFLKLSSNNDIPREEIIERLRASVDIPNNAVDYFAVIGMNVFLDKSYPEIIGGKTCQ